MIELAAVRAIAHQEFVINVRNRWMLIFACAFGALVLAISYFGLVTAGATGFQGFARTSASLLSLVIYVIPLVTLIMGTQSFTGERNSGELLFAQPVTRTEILAGKLLGLFISVFSSTLIGFGLAGMVIAARGGSDGFLRYPLLVAFSLALALIFLNISALASAICRRKSIAFGFALFLWFFFVLFYDLAVLGGTFLLPERAANTFLFGSLLGNPVDMVRIASLIALNGKETFGSAGAALLAFLGGERNSILFLLAGLLLWILLPFLLARRILDRQDI